MRYEIFIGLCGVLLLEAAFVAQQIAPDPYSDLAFILLSLIAMPIAATLAIIAILLSVIMR